MRRAESSSRPLLMRPLSTASTIAAIASGTAFGDSTTSEPASIARTEASPMPYMSVIPRIVMASVNTIPSKPMSLRRMSVITSGDSVAGGPPGPRISGSCT